MLTTLFNFLLPAHCLLCQVKNPTPLCQACHDELPWLNNHCQRCALPLKASENLTCGDCLQKPTSFDHTIALFDYHDDIRPLISRFKFQRKLAYGQLLSGLLLEKLQDYYQQQVLPELIIPIPLHTKRLRKRGFNQALELVKPIAKQLSIPIDTRRCQRIRATPAQTTVSAKQRRKNMHGAFAVCDQLTAKHIALVDDVMTTGTTLRACCDALREVGVERIDVWCLARAGYR